MSIIEYNGKLNDHKEYNNYKDLGEYSDYEYGPNKSNSTHIVCN